MLRERLRNSGKSEKGTLPELGSRALMEAGISLREPGLGWASLTYFDGHFACLTEDGTLRLIRANPERYEPRAEIILRGRPEDGRRAVEAAFSWRSATVNCRGNME